MSNLLDNILSCGYLREYEQFNETHIPDDVQQIIIKYSKQYAIYSIGTDHPLEAMNKLIGDPSDIYTNQYGINIKSRSNELYILNNNTFDTNNTITKPTSLSIKSTSHGTSNDTNLFIYTSNNLLFNTQIYSDNNSLQIQACQFYPISTQFLYNYDNIKDIQCGINHTLILTELGNVYSMGLNDVGQCGFNIQKYENISNPKLMIENIQSIAVGAFHNLLLNNKYELYVCGYNYVGQLGITETDLSLQHFDSDTYISDSPETIEIIEYEIYNSDSDSDSMAYLESESENRFHMIDTSESDSDSDCYFNKYDKYGNQTLLFIDTPILNQYFNDNNIQINKIYCGKFHSLIIDNNGNVYTFGSNTFGQTGNGENNKSFDYSNPIPEMIINNGFVIDGDNTLNQCSKINKSKIINKPYIIN